jgi:cobaltochelatase CobN
METENPYATKDVISRLLEAYDRGMWDADDDTIDKLKDAFIEVEGEIEGRQDAV